MNPLPLFYYPTTVMVIDDDLLFLEAIRGFLKEDYQLKNFNNPARALDFLKSYIAPSSELKFVRGCKDQDSYHLTGHLPVDIDLRESKEFRSNPQRSSEISVIIVDYNMPGTNGIEICRALKSLPVKKILLTGEASNETAVKAFNDGLIDCFLQKGNLDLPKDIRFQIKRLSQQYLAERTNQLSKHLETDYLLPLSDPVFADHFNQLQREYAIQEYFVIDQLGSLILIDKNHEQYYLAIHTERTLDNFTELYEDSKETQSLIRETKAREKIPFFGEHIEAWDIELGEWDKYFYAPQILEGRETYYWAMIKNS